MLTRRTLLAAPAALATVSLDSAGAKPFDEVDISAPLPHKKAFSPLASTYLNCASQHPLSLEAKAAVARHLEYRSFSSDLPSAVSETYLSVLSKYARLIGAEDDEVCYVQSTTVGENLVMHALGLPEPGARIVTDELHFIGSMPMYSQFADQGMEVLTARVDGNGRIDLDQFEKAIDKNTRLVTVSLVSMINGFEQDLAGLCEIAHANGALVYADIVQAVGSFPFDVRQSGVDFCSTSTYKWLMGEMGLGFFFARKDRLDTLERPWYGHYQLAQRRDIGYPSPERREQVTEFEHIDGTRGYFAMGSQANIIAAMLDRSIDYLLAVGAERIEAYRQPMIDRLQEDLPELGYRPLTPEGSRTALVSFRHDGADALRERLKAANVTITVAPHHLRVSPSVFNDMDDIERLIEALG